MSSNVGTPGGEPKCRWCQSPMLVDASVCPVCTKNQSKFWNLAPNVSLLFTLVAAFFSGVLFIYSQSAKIIEEITWKDNAEIWKLDSIGESIIRNTGGGDIFASGIELSAADFSQSFEIGKIVKKGTLEKSSPSFSITSGPPFRPLSKEEIEEGVMPSSFVFLSSNAERLISWRRLLSKIGKTLEESPGKATLRFSSLKDNSTHAIDVPCIVVPIYID